MRPYRQARIWAYLTANPGSPPRAIRAALRMTSHSVYQALARMEETGHARKTGTGYWANIAWYADGDKPPIDGRGFSPSSVAAFDIERRRNWLENLEKAAKVTGRKPPKRVDTSRLNQSCELARVWINVADASIVSGEAQE